MIRHLASILFVTALLTSCGNTSKEKIHNNQSEAAEVEFTSLSGNPAEYIGKTISVEGKVVHVCTHSGKKLFIVGDNPDIRLYIQAGETMPKFPMELLGSTVVVEGTLTKVAGTQMSEHEGAEPGMQHEGTIAADTCETATAMASQVALADVMMEYRSHIVK